jgi:type III secretion protein D
VSKRLRILTGRHAGASQDLAVGIHTVGRTDDCQIFITDWSAQQIGLAFEVFERDGVESLVWLMQRQDSDPAVQRRHALRDFQPVRFGDIVVCAGPVSSDWPSDAVLLKKIFGPASMIRRFASRYRALLCGVTATTGVLVLFGLTMQSSVAEPATPVKTPEARAASIAAHLKNLGIEGINVTAQGGAIVVAGLVGDAQQGERLHAALQTVDGAGALSHHYATASQVEQVIQGGLGEPHVRVSHRGQGVFAIEGHVTSLDTLKQKAHHLANDMRSTIQRIDVLATEQAGSVPKHVTAVLADDTDPYVRTAEGVKHLGFVQLPPTARPADSPAATASLDSPAQATSTAGGRANLEQP